MFGAIYIDFPLSFEVWSKDTGGGRSAESHYGTMTAAQIEALPIENLAAKDCCLFVWTTWTHLPFVVGVAEKHGFTYKTCAFLWSKTNKVKRNLSSIESDDNWFLGMGYWTRANTEPCLLFTKGKPKRKSRSVRQLVVSPVQSHSRKPDEIHKRIEALVDGPYIELFARRKYEGWTTLGNEISGRDITVDIHELLSPKPEISLF